MRMLSFLLVMAVLIVVAPVLAEEKNSPEKTKPVPRLHDIKARIRAGKDYEGRLKVFSGATDTSWQERAQKAYSGVMSEEFQKKVKSDEQRIKKALLPEKPTDTAVSGVTPGRSGAVLSNQERIYLFVSSSMPTETLRAYAADIDRLGDPNVFMVMRGMVGGMRLFKPTREFFMEFTSRRPGCDPMKSGCALYDPNLIVDPLLFRRYGIAEVPAVVYVPSISLELVGSEGLPENARVGDYYVRRGDASLAWHIGVLHKKLKMASLDAAKRRIDVAPAAGGISGVGR